ncbi:MAG: hypothetical protein FJ304_01320 [Planctomycetes bacterium]|nr:hypothetical protein [Planctomycetota bacterium]
MSLRIVCPNCSAALTLGRAPARGWVHCPRCTGRIDLAAPVAEELPPDEPDAPAPPPARARARSVGESLARAAIPLGYVLFVLVPMIFTIRFAMQQLEKPKEPAAPVDVAEDNPPRAELEPKAKGPRPKKKRPIEPEEVIPPVQPVPAVPGPRDAPPPRDLSAELDAAVLRSRDPNPSARRGAAPALARFLSKSDPTVRRKAMMALSEMSGDAEPARAAVRAATDDPDEVVQLLARRALVSIDAAERARKELFALAGELRAKGTDARVAALNKIAGYGKGAATVGDAVIDALRDKEKAVRDAAAEALARFHPDAKTIALCVTGLQARDPKARIETLDQIGALGAEAKGASEYLIEAMLDNGPGVQAAAFKAMERVNPPLHVPLVTVFHGQPNQRRAALDRLAQLGADAGCTVPLLLVCNDKPQLWGTDPHYDLFPAIAKIAPHDRRFVAAVLASVAAPNPANSAPTRARRLAGLAQLDAIDADARSKVDALATGLADKSTQPAVIAALAEYGADAKPALPALKELTASPTEAVRTAAVAAVVKIEAALADK